MDSVRIMMLSGEFREEGECRSLGSQVRTIVAMVASNSNNNLIGLALESGARLDAVCGLAFT